jgi:hypothetical protein
VLISYRKEMNNRIYQALYGFVPQGGNYNDDIEIPLSVLLGPEGVGACARDEEDLLTCLPHLWRICVRETGLIVTAEDGKGRGTNDVERTTDQETDQGVEFLRALDHPKIMRLTAPLLEQALGLDGGNAEQILSQDPRLNAVLLSLPLSPTMPADGCDGDQEVITAQTLLAYMAGKGVLLL